LQKLFLCANKISRIENVGHLKNLTLLELGDNKIRASGSRFNTTACFFHCCITRSGQAAHVLILQYVSFIAVLYHGMSQWMQAFCVMKLLCSV
jgi:hypothetical protein